MTHIELDGYISSSLAAGKTKEALYAELLGKGWDLEAIQSAFVRVGPGVEHKHKGTVGTVVTLGAISIGLGVFSFIAANWDGMGDLAKVVILLVSMIVAYGLGWAAEHRAKLPKTAGALYFLGTLIYGGGIFLVAQIYNIQANWPDGFLLWILGALIVGFAVDAFSIFYLALILVLFAVGGAPFYIFWDFSPASFLLTSTLLLLVSGSALLASGALLRERMPADIRNRF